MDNLVLLTSTVEKAEAMIIEGILRNSGINCIIQYRDAGGYTAVVYGNTFLGVDIFVQPDNLELAKELLACNNLIQQELKQETKDFNVEKYSFLSILNKVTLFFIRVILFIGAIELIYEMIGFFKDLGK